ncbi:MAG: hypothetical protein COS89_05710 [Deltaproteobacteria bacterium CG07_land_8_20_14_0_80_38_7]|nr:MAG: hypothetical protein COS89_05710 [Deltaproteobacteria bacterium CG07_land_8_20_14_0_80_38_7]
MENINNYIERKLATLKLIWAAMFIFLSTYLIVAFFNTPEDVNISMLDEHGIYLKILIICGIITFAGRGFLKKYLLNLRIPQISTMNITDEQRSVAMILAEYTKATIISLAISEVIAILGLMAYFMNEINIFYIFIVAAALSMIASKPSFSEVNRLLQSINISLQSESEIGVQQKKPFNFSILFGVVPILIIAGIFYMFFGSELEQREILKTGKPAKALLLNIEPTGTIINDQPQVKMLIEVKAPELNIYQTELKMVISPVYLPQFQPGAVLNIKYDSDDPSRVAVESVVQKNLPNPDWSEDSK